MAKSYVWEMTVDYQICQHKDEDEDEDEGEGEDKDEDEDTSTPILPFLSLDLCSDFN